MVIFISNTTKYIFIERPIIMNTAPEKTSCIFEHVALHLLTFRVTKPHWKKFQR